jgi:hypothetical protein
MKFSLHFTLFAAVMTYAEGSYFLGGRTQKISIQELQSAAGPKHSDGIVSLVSNGNAQIGTDVAMVWFANDLVVPGTVKPGTGPFEGGKPMGTQTGRK